MMKHISFGEFIEKKRKKKKLTLRVVAEQLDISPPYLSDVEKNRRNPFSLEKLNLLASILVLSEKDRIMMLNLAGKERNEIAPDLPSYIIERDYVRDALRIARDLDAGKEDWLQFVEWLKGKSDNL